MSAKKYTVTLSLLLFVFTLSARPPKWLRTTPVAENATYYYVVESATDINAQAAENKAISKVFLNTVMRLGYPVTPDEVNKAISAGDIPVASRNLNIKVPMQKVCHYKQKINGGYRVYVLCQVATEAHSTPDFTQFNCPIYTSDDKELMSPPEEWNKYDEDLYFNKTLYDEKEKRDDSADSDFISRVEAKTKEALAREIGIDEHTDLMQMIHTDHRYINPVVYSIAYLSKNDVAGYYRNLLGTTLQRIDMEIGNSRTYISEGNKPKCESALQLAKEKVEEARRYLNKLQLCGVSEWEIKRNRDDIKDLSENINDQMFAVEGSAAKNRRKKIQDYINVAQRSEIELKIGDALRYYYWANVLLMNTENSSEISDDNGNRLAIWLPDKINSIMDDVRVEWGGYTDERKTLGLLHFTFQGKVISYMDYTCNNGRGWNNMPIEAKNGKGIVEIVEGDNPATIGIALEYKYKTAVAADPEIANFIDDMQNPKFRKSRKTVNVNNAAKTGPVYAPTDAMAMGSFSEISNSEQYNSIINRVCNAISSKQYSAVRPLFDEQGFDVFNKLIAYGNARVVAKNGLRYMKTADGHMFCRGLSMDFRFERNNKTFLEDVVFEFNEQNLICNISFALENQTVNSIMSRKAWSETSRMTIINFLENYKTAFALERLDYIESMFSNDALIIVGNVVYRTTPSADGMNLQKKHIEYNTLSKSEYIKRLEKGFKSKEYINIKFANADILPIIGRKDMYQIQLKQDYNSSNYGDQGYLFLVLDITNPKRPIIHVRAWQPEPDPNFGTYNISHIQ